MASKVHGNAEADRCLIGIRTLTAAGIRIVLPEIADDAIRRELLRVGVGRLNRLRSMVNFDPMASGRTA